MLYPINYIHSLGVIYFLHHNSSRNNSFTQFIHASHYTDSYLTRSFKYNSSSFLILLTGVATICNHMACMWEEGNRFVIGSM